MWRSGRPGSKPLSIPGNGGSRRTSTMALTTQQYAVQLVIGRPEHRNPPEKSSRS
jgi:hypothetical protein